MHLFNAPCTMWRQVRNKTYLCRKQGVVERIIWVGQGTCQMCPFKKTQNHEQSCWAYSSKSAKMQLPQRCVLRGFPPFHLFLPSVGLALRNFQILARPSQPPVKKHLGSKWMNSWSTNQPTKQTNKQTNKVLEMFSHLGMTPLHRTTSGANWMPWPNWIHGVDPNECEIRRFPFGKDTMHKTPPSWALIS